MDQTLSEMEEGQPLWKSNVWKPQEEPHILYLYLWKQPKWRKENFLILFLLLIAMNVINQVSVDNGSVLQYGSMINTNNESS